MTFDVSADAYASFMGPYAEPLAPQFVDLTGIGPGDKALDVGCGPGTVTDVLVDRLGAANVVAVDPSPSFVVAARERFPDVEVREGAAENLPFAEASFDVAVAQLVVPFMADPVQGLSEMRRVVRPGGTVAACAWDSERGPLAPFWQAADDLDPGAARSTDRPGSREGQLAELMTAAGLEVTRSTTLSVRVQVASFEEWWRSLGHGIGTAGEYYVSLTTQQQGALRVRCTELLPGEPFEVDATARAATARRG